MAAPGRRRRDQDVDKGRDALAAAYAHTRGEERGERGKARVRADGDAVEEGAGRGPATTRRAEAQVAAADRDWGDWTEARARRGPGVRRRGRPDGPGHRRGTHGPVQPACRPAETNRSGAGLGVAQR